MDQSYWQKAKELAECHKFIWTLFGYIPKYVISKNSIANSANVKLSVRYLRYLFCRNFLLR